MSLEAAAGLAAAMGVGRFVFTPLLPIMTEAAGISATDGAVIATANYAGYLLGAVLLARRPHLSGRATFLAWSAALVASEAAMAATTEVAAQAGVRFVAGVASASIFIACASTVTRHRSEGASPGIAFAGVGAGIAVTGVYTLAAAPHLSWQGLWIGSAVLTCVLIAPALFLDIRSETTVPTIDAATRPGAPSPRAWRLLLASYFAEGLGYIVVGTFLVAAVGGAEKGSSSGALVWTVVGIAVVPSTFVWHAVARRMGTGTALVTALALQTVGTALPALSTAPAVTAVSAILFGATFIAITMLTMDLGHRMSVASAAATLTAAYAVGQVAGPLVVAPVLGDSYDTAFVIAATVLAVSTALAIAANRTHVKASSHV